MYLPPPPGPPDPWNDEFVYGYPGVDATFRPIPERARSFLILLNAVTKADASAFDHLGALDFTAKSWIEIGATRPNPDRPSLTAKR